MATETNGYALLVVGLMKADELGVGRAYFMCGYYFRHSPIPSIETWIYAGPETDPEGTWHRFQDPATYYPEEYAKEVPEDSRGELPEIQTIRVRDEDIEMVYGIEELEQFVARLRSELNADKVF